MIVPDAERWKRLSLLFDELLDLEPGQRQASLDALRAEGCNVLGKAEESEYGKFGWVLDPEGNKVELWEPPSGQ